MLKDLALQTVVRWTGCHGNEHHGIGLRNDTMRYIRLYTSLPIAVSRLFLMVVACGAWYLLHRSGSEAIILKRTDSPHGVRSERTREGARRCLFAGRG